MDIVGNGRAIPIWVFGRTVKNNHEIYFLLLSAQLTCDLYEKSFRKLMMHPSLKNYSSKYHSIQTVPFVKNQPNNLIVALV